MSFPVLSICIPTRNRCHLLRLSLESLTRQPIFSNTDAVEIVVSDNASDDETAEVVDKFIKKYGEKKSGILRIQRM